MGAIKNLMQALKLQTEAGNAIRTRDINLGKVALYH
jgi:hypothetical protein